MSQYLEQLLNDNGATLTATVGELQTFYERRQWHQLTEALIRATFGASASAGENKAEEQKAEASAVFDNVNLVNMYNDFVSTFESKISPVSLVRFVAAAASRHLCPSTPATAEQVKAAHDLLDRLKDSDVKKKRLGEGALAYLNHERISFSVRGAGPVLTDEKRAELKDGLSKARSNLASLPSSEVVDSVVTGSFYRAAAEFHRLAGQSGKFYKDALMYFAYTPVNTVSAEQRLQWAQDVSIAALLGDGVYNFGEVLANDMLNVLKGSDVEWLLQMLEAFNRGDITAFNGICQTYGTQINGTPGFQKPGTLDKVGEKLQLLAVVELIFRRPAQERTISFSDLAQAIRQDVDKVEWILMKAMSVGLIKGVIDQVGQELHASWVQPRILDQSQIESVSKRVAEWSDQVRETLTFVEGQTPQLFM